MSDRDWTAHIKNLEAEQEPKRGWRINPYYFFGFIGIALYASWLFLSYLNPQLNSEQLFALPWEGGEARGGLTAQLPMIVVAILALGLAWYFSDFLSTNTGKRVLLVLAVCLGPCSGLAPLLANWGLAEYSFIPWALSGFGYAALLLLWSTLLITLEHKQILLFLTAVLIVGAAIYVFTASSLPYASMFFTALLPIASVVCFVLSLNTRRQIIGTERAGIVVSASESDEKDPINWRLIADTLTYTPCLGIGIYLIMHDFDYPANIVCVGLATIVSCVILIADTQWLHALTSKMQLRLFLPLAAIIVFPLSFVSGIAELVFIFLLFTVFMLSLVTNYSAISLCVRVFELSPIRVFAYGRAFNLLGVLAGYLFATLAFSDALAAGEGVGTILAFCGLMLVFILASTFVLEDHYPVSSEVADGEISLEESAIPKRDSWDERCAQVAEEYGLSPRQSEILGLLSKGRNTVYIKEKLVISHYTAKAHIYNIYQKMGIHSRQELLNLIEMVELEG
ncbi:MAG: helix-turn-helix transcriptional regulator [Coriobacteriales bacterium]|jgi:DNA-binding CsgD family transcriptional regulator|nr:helix-turn-helix transcriptional regulator [Coriobacteriales bacterium]